MKKIHLFEEISLDIIFNIPIIEIPLENEVSHKLKSRYLHVINLINYSLARTKLYYKVKQNISFNIKI